MSKDKKQIRELVQLLCRSNTPAIYADNIAHRLQCSVNVVETELYRMYEEGNLRHIYELRCCRCGHVITTAEDKMFFTNAQRNAPAVGSRPNLLL